MQCCELTRAALDRTVHAVGGFGEGGGREAGGGGEGGGAVGAGWLSWCNMTDQNVRYANMEVQVGCKHRAHVLAAVLTNDPFELLLGV